ncbi:MAG: alpha-amylase family glycosyl hydrolase [Phycisphaerales bacterium]
MSDTAHQPGRVVVTPISTPLGLVDVTLTPATPLRSAAIRARWEGSDALVPSVPLHRSSGHDGEVLTARLALGARADGAAARMVYELTTIGAFGDRSVSVSNSVSMAMEPGLCTPDWAKGLVWYQVFPERFCNGDTSNDPAGPEVFAPGWESDWETVTTTELEHAQARAMADPRGRTPGTTHEGATLRAVMNARRYGGDLQGVMQRTDHLRALGVGGVYLTPIFRARSAHKYECADFRHADETLAGTGNPHRKGLVPGEDFAWSSSAESTDPATWTFTAADRFVIDRFLPALRSAGLRVIFDGVFNHTGKEHFAFVDVLAHGRQSPFANWYDAVYSTGSEQGPGGARPPGMLLSWRGYGHRSSDLPCFAQTEDRDLVEPVRRHIFDITARWMAPEGDPQRGIDGWRLDVAADIGLPFWSAWRTHAKSINPDALLIGEVWFDAERFFRGAAFDGQMNYPLATALTGWLGREPAFTTLRLWRELRDILHHHPATELVQFNLLTSHDTDRLTSMLHNPGRAYDQGEAPSTRPGGYDGGRPSEEAARRAALGWAIIALLPGAPMIYQGEEWAMWGADDPHNRKPVTWPTHDRGSDLWNPVPPPFQRMFDHVARFMRLRADPDLGPTLRLGGLREHACPGHPEVFAFERQLNATRLLVIANRAATPQPIHQIASPGWTAVVGGEGGEVGPFSVAVLRWNSGARSE